MICSQLVSSPG